MSIEQLMSALGLVAILGLAYAFSNNRRAINPRTIVWGVGLQLLFGVIILKENVWSFVGMFALVFMVVLYILQEEFERSAFASSLLALVALVACGSLVALFYWLATYNVTLILLAIAAAVLIVGVKTDRSQLSHIAMISIMVLGLAQLWATGTDGRSAFDTMSDKVTTFLQLSDQGAAFLFANLADNVHQAPTDTWPGFGFQFAFRVLPTIIFFSAFMSVLYYLGIIQVLILALGRFMRWTLRTSGSETMSCSANVFVGQTEAPFLVKPFLHGMTSSELHAIMVGGFATIAGGVLAAYIGMGVDAQHLIAASVMSAPAALVLAKLLYPETEESETAGELEELPEIETADNMVEAAANGTIDGLKLALNVGAMLIAFISLIAFLDMVLGYFDRLIDGGWLGGVAMANAEFSGIVPGSMKTLFGTVLAPLAFVMGVPWEDARAVGNLLGIKLTVNELVAYLQLSEHIRAQDLSPRSLIIATYALCGFANFSSIGIQIGGISSLAPELRPKLSRLAIRALAGGALASFTTATVAGMLLAS